MAPDRAEKNLQAAGAPRPLELGGRVLLCDPPTVKENSLIGLECKKHTKAQTPLQRVARDPAFAELPAACQLEAVRVAAQSQAAGETGLTLGEWLEAMASPPVLSLAVWLCCRRNHPELTCEQVRGWVTEDNAAEVLARFLEASSMDRAGPEGNSAGPPGSTPTPSTPAGST
jgi:hypothetical protein